MCSSDERPNAKQEEAGENSFFNVQEDKTEQKNRDERRTMSEYHDTGDERVFAEKKNQP